MKQQTSIAEIETDEYTCPLCGHECQEIADEITQADLIAVNKMYKTIFDEINSIGEDTGILPQIIIVDHVDGKNLECKEEFERYIRCNWRNDKGLI